MQNTVIKVKGIGVTTEIMLSCCPPEAIATKFSEKKVTGSIIFIMYPPATHEDLVGYKS